MSFFAIIDAATGDVLDVVRSLDGGPPPPAGAIVVELPARGEDVRAWLAAHARERGGGGIDEAMAERDEHGQDRRNGRVHEIHDAEVFYARLQQMILRAELEGRHAAVLLFTIAPSDKERVDEYVMAALSGARQELLPCDTLSVLRPHLAAVLMPDVDARDLAIPSPHGRARALTFPGDAAEIDALRRRRHPWLSLRGTFAA